METKGLTTDADIPAELMETQLGMGLPKAPEKAPVSVKSADDVVVVFKFQALRMSSILTCMNNEYPDDTIPIQLVKGNILEFVKEYCEYHHDKPVDEIEKPLRSTRLSECGVSAWDENFINKPNDQLQELILAANYLDVKPLLELCAAKIASLMKGKSVEELRSEFNIENDFSPEEEALIREENRWIDDA
eukprot:GHVH01000065.1.p1 GENE.GHVH01000065.1~~GHVH01000065.1.p1  ORF type:complete len:190 (+),score=33.40 GHVH01000065.1:106-675(+)